MSTKKLTQDEFIKRASTLHNGRYDYSEVEYISMSHKVNVICKLHGIFSILPKNHIHTLAGCKKCGDILRGTNRSLKLGEFITRLKAVHNERYCYSKVNLINAHTKVTMICKDHGDFDISPKKLLEGQGCKKCGLLKNTIKRKKLPADFIKQANIVHSNKYSYESSNYNGCDIKIEIYCEQHGIFSQTPAAHLSGQGCPSCGHERTIGALKSNTKDFIEKSRTIHNIRYDYSKVKFRGSKTPVNIICYEHGEFLQSSDSHLKGRGCPSCASYGFSQLSPANLYLLKYENLYKIGITNNDIAKRVSQINRSSGKNFEIIDYIVNEDGSFIFSLEKQLLSFLREKYTQPVEKFDGSTECFYDINIEELTLLIHKEII